MKIKKCNQCGLWKPLNISFWHKNCRSRDGFLTICKKCISANKPWLKYDHKQKEVQERQKHLKKIVGTLSNEYVKNQLYKQGVDRKDITPLMLRRKRSQILSSRLRGVGNVNSMTLAELDRLISSKKDVAQEGSNG